MNIFKRLIALLAMYVAAGSASAVLLQVDTTTGKLTGATGIVVGGQSYDVKFMEGTCIALFNGCDSTSDFFFKDKDDARAAAEAMLDQVFVDGPSGAFDSISALTFGCEDTYLYCVVITPYLPPDPLSALSITASVVFMTNQDSSTGFSDGRSNSGVVNSADTGSAPHLVFAVWSESRAAVPEPSVLALAGIALFGAAAVRRRAGR